MTVNCAQFVPIARNLELGTYYYIYIIFSYNKIIDLTHKRPLKVDLSITPSYIVYWIDTMKYNSANSAPTKINVFLKRNKS